MANDMKLQFNIGASFSELKAAAAQAKAELLSLVNTVKQAGQEVKIKVGLDIAGLNSDIQSLKSTVRNALQGSATEKIKVKIEADAAAIRADILAIRPQIQQALGSFAPISLTINHAKLAQHLQAAEAQVRAAIARMTTPTALRLNLNIDSTASGLIKAINELKVEVNSLKQVMARGGGRSGTGGSGGGGLGGASSDVNGFSSAIRDARNQLMQLVSAFGVLIGIKAFASITDEAKSLESKLKLVTSSQEELNQVTAALREIAKNNLQGLAPTVELYARLSSATKSLDGANAALNTRLTDIVSKLVTISGSTGPEAAGVIIQFAQAIGNNFSAAGQEINSMNEQAGALSDAIAKIYNTDRAGLKDLGAKGLLSTEVIINGLMQQGKEVDALFGKVNKTIGGTATTTGDSIKRLISEVDKSVGASKAIIGFLENVRNKATEMWAQMEADGSQSIKNFFETAQDVISLLIGYGLTRLAASLAVSTKGFYSQAVAAQVAANQTLVNARADVLATSMALRRAEAEKANALAVLASARASGLAAAQTSAAMAQAATATAAATSAAAAHAAAQRALATATTQANIAVRASSGIISALGGPIGAIITLLGTAATAWLVFGNNAEKAVDKVQEAMKKVNNKELLNDDDLQALSDGLKNIESQILNRTDELRASLLSSNGEALSVAIQKDIDELIKQKKKIEEDIKTIQFNRNLDSAMADLDNKKIQEVKSKPKPSSTDPFAIEKSRLEAELQDIEAKYSAEQIGMNKYFIDKKRILEALHKNEIDNIQAKIDKEKDADKKGDLMTKLEGAKIAKKSAIDLNNIDWQKARKDAQEKSEEMLKDIKLEGIADKFDKLDEELKTKREKLLKEFKEQTLNGYEDQAEAAKKIAEYEIDLDKRTNEAIAKNNLDRIQEELKTFIDLQANKVKSLEAKREAGKITNTEAKTETDIVNEKTRDRLALYIAELEKIAPTSAEAKRTLEELRLKMLEIPPKKDAETEMQAFWNNINKSAKETTENAAKSGLSQFFMDIAEGAKSGTDAVRDFGRNFALSMAKVAADALAAWAVMKLIGLVGSGGSGAAPMVDAPNLTANANVAHTGGIAGGALASRKVDMSLFNAAPRYHAGGIAGLQPGEVPAILQRGEEVLTQKDPRHVANGGGQPRGVTIINEFTREGVLNHIASSEGNEVLFNIIGDNPNRIRTLLGV